MNDNYLFNRLQLFYDKRYYLVLILCNRLQFMTNLLNLYYPIP
jgi:hypothetical protein